MSSSIEYHRIFLPFCYTSHPPVLHPFKIYNDVWLRFNQIHWKTVVPQMRTNGLIPFMKGREGSQMLA